MKTHKKKEKKKGGICGINLSFYLYRVQIISYLSMQTTCIQYVEQMYFVYVMEHTVENQQQHKRGQKHMHEWGRQPQEHMHK